MHGAEAQLIGVGSAGAGYWRAGEDAATRITVCTYSNRYPGWRQCVSRGTRQTECMAPSLAPDSAQEGDDLLGVEGPTQFRAGIDSA